MGDKNAIVEGFRCFSEINASRCEDSFHKVDAWSVADWMVALAGEVGEAANIIKKMRRGDLKLPFDRELLAHELADVVTYVDLLATRCGIELGVAVAEKFNIVSKRVGSKAHISTGGEDGRKLAVSPEVDGTN